MLKYDETKSSTSVSALTINGSVISSGFPSAISLLSFSFHARSLLTFVSTTNGEREEKKTRRELNNTQFQQFITHYSLHLLARNLFSFIRRSDWTSRAECERSVRFFEPLQKLHDFISENHRERRVLNNMNKRGYRLDAIWLSTAQPQFELCSMGSIDGSLHCDLKMKRKEEKIALNYDRCQVSRTRTAIFGWMLK